PGIVQLHLLAPSAQQVAAPPRIVLALLARRRDPVGAKGAIGVAQFAPGDDDAHLIEEAQSQRPDQPLAGHLAGISIIDVQFGLSANSLTEYVQRHRIRRKTITRRPRHYGWVV